MKPAQARPVTFERRGANAPRTAYTPKAWNHQDELKSLIGKPIALLLPDGAVKTGILLGADQFAIKVELARDSGGKSALTLLKGSGFVGFGAA
jgi:hypothetical protein